MKSIPRPFFNPRTGENYFFRSRISDEGFRIEMLKDAEILKQMGIKYKGVIDIKLSLWRKGDK